MEASSQTSGKKIMNVNKPFTKNQFLIKPQIYTKTLNTLSLTHKGHNNH